MNLYPYLTDYFPPIPAIEISLGYPDEALRMGPLPAIVDTGADGTLIPQALIDDLAAPFIDDMRIRSHWGEWRSVQLFTLDIGIGEFRLSAIEVAGDEEGDEIILGRNVLNKLRLHLNGPGKQVKVTP